MLLNTVTLSNDRLRKSQKPCRKPARKELRPSCEKKKRELNVSILLNNWSRNGRITSRKKLSLKAATTSKASRRSSTTWSKRRLSSGNQSTHSKRNVRHSNNRLLRLWFASKKERLTKVKIYRRKSRLREWRTRSPKAKKKGWWTSWGESIKASDKSRKRGSSWLSRSGKAKVKSTSK